MGEEEEKMGEGRTCTFAPRAVPAQPPPAPRLVLVVRVLTLVQLRKNNY